MYISLKITLIDGEIPPIDSKNGKIGNLALHKRKTSAYLPRNGLHSKINRKISAYYSGGYSIEEDKTSSRRAKSNSFIVETPDILRYSNKE